ncbi:MAG: RHS repeat-associated core domain-containing protein [Anaerolineales bacterium]|nr:RHS repeat-associated core domain-containing protein [Anaerolineales bacterium]
MYSAEYNTADWAYYLPDALGSVRQITDATGAVTYAQTFKPYGEALSSTGEAGSNYGFAGEWTDETGLQYLRARYYAPAMGRFASKDTWEGVYSSPQTLNKWGYVMGNPVNYIDPSGMFAETKELSGVTWKSTVYGITINYLQPALLKYNQSGTAVKYISKRHPLNVVSLFNPCLVEKDGKLVYDIEKVRQTWNDNFTVWELNARNIVAEMGAAFYYEEAWAIPDAIGMAYTPYNRAKFGPLRFTPWGGANDEIKSYLLSGGQLGIMNRHYYAMGPFADLFEKAEDIHDISLIIAFGVHQNYLMDTSYGAHTYTHRPKDAYWEAVLINGTWTWQPGLANFSGFACTPDGRDSGPAFFKKGFYDEGTYGYGFAWSTYELEERSGVGFGESLSNYYESPNLLPACEPYNPVGPGPNDKPGKCLEYYPGIGVVNPCDKKQSRIQYKIIEP